MSREVDERVVSMKFDNRNFEANVNETMSTIDKLKKKLVFERDKETFKPIEDSARRINFNPLEKGIEKVKIKFSALQVVGATALSEITKSAMHLSGVMNKTFSLLTSGGMARALNVENAKHQLEGLGVAWDKVGDSIQTAVQGTAYGSDEASAVASQLVASGIKIRKNAADVDSEMDHALQSIAGVAAMTNSSYSEIGDIYTTIAGQGKLMGMQLQQLSTRGMNGAAALGKALGKTEAEIREMTRKGQIDFVTFSEAMYKQFAEFSQSADKTYEGSLANMQAAIKRIGQDVASGHLANMQKIFVNAKKAINDFHTALMPVINVINTALAGAAHIATRSIQILNDTINDSGSAFTSIADVARRLLNVGTPLISLEKEFERAGVSTKQFKKAMMQTAKEHGVNVKKMIKEDGSYRNSLKRGWLTNEIFEESVERLIKTQKKSGKSTEDQIKQLKALKDQTGKTGSVVDQNLKMMEKATGGQLFRDSIKNIFYGLKNSIQSIKEAYKDIFPKSETMGLYTLIDRFNKLTKKLKLNETQMDRMKRIFKGVFAVIDLVKIAVKSLVDGLSNLGKALSGDVNFTFGEFLARIGDLLVKIHDWVKENKLIETSISGFCKWLGKAITNVRDFFKSFANSKGFESFGEMLAYLFEKFTNDGLPLLKEISGGLLGKVAEFFKNIFDGIKDSTVLSNFINYLSGMNDELDETATWFDKLVYLAKGGQIIIEGVFTALKDFFTSTWDKVWPKIDGVITKIKEKINNFNWGAPASFMVSFLAYKLAQDLLNTIKIVKGPFEAFEKFTKALTVSVMDLTTAAKKLISAKAFKMIAQGMMYICASIIILAAAMDKFGTDKVLVAAGTLTIFALVVGKVTSSLLYATQSLNASQMKRLSQLLVIFAGGLLAMSAAFAVIAYAVKNLNPDQMVAAGVVLGALAVGLVALCKFGLNQLPVVNGRVENLTKALFPFIGAITALSLAIYFMGKLNTGQLIQGLGALVVTLVGLAGVIFAMSKIPGEGKLGRTMFGIAAGVLVMTTALTILSQIKLENLLEGVINLGIVLVALAGVFLTTRLLSKTSAKAGATVVGAALSLFAIVIALQWIHNMDAKALFNGVKAFVPLFIALGVVSLLAGGVGESVHKAALTMMGAALSVAILAGALAALSLLPVEGMVKGIGAIWALLLGLGVMVKSVGGLSDAKIKDASKIFVAVTTTAIALMAGLAILSMFDTVSLLAASASIYAVFISMGALLRAIEHAQGVRISGSVIRTIAIATLVVGSLVALTAALNALFKADSGASVVYIAAAVAVLAYAMIPIARAIQVMSTIKMRDDIAKTVAGLAAGIAAMTILVGIIAGIASGKKIGPEILTITGSMILLAVAMVPLAAAMRVLGSVPIPITMQSLAPLGIGVLALMGLIALMAGIPEKACKAAVKGASYLGKVVGALIGGFTAGITEAVMGTLPTLAGYIREFIAELKPAMQNLGEFPASAIKGAAVAVAAITLMAVVAAECVPIAALSIPMLAAGLAINVFALELIPFFKLLDKHVDQKAVDKVDIISNIMLKLGAASFLSAFSNLMDNLSRFAFGKDDSGKLVDMAAMAIAFCDATKDLTVEQVSKADTAAKVISTLAAVKLPKKGGFIQAIVGHEDWEGFGKGLEGMAKGLKVLSEQTTGIDTKAIDKVIPIMDKLFKLEMPKDTTGSFIGFMTGNTIPMDRFGNQMTSFGEALVAFNESTKDISSDKSTIKGLESVVGIMTALFSIKMPKDTHGTAAGFFTGDTESMSSMGTDLTNFASNFVTFSNTLSQMDPDVVANVDTMMQSLSKIQNTQYSGIEQTIKESTEKTTGDSMLEGMKTAGNKVKEKGTPIIQGALSATADAVDPTSGSLGTNIASIGGDFMNQLGTGFVPGAGSFDVSNISGSIENTLTQGVENTDITKMQKEMENIGKNGLDGLATGAKSKANEVAKTYTDVSKAAWNSAGDHIKEAKEAGTTQAGAFNKGLGESKNKAKAKKTVKDLANSAAADENFRAAKTNMVKNGAWLIEGLIEGINSKKGAVKSKMKEVTDNTNTVVTKTDEIGSPSKLYRRFGGWLMEGFALGIDDNAYKVTKSMSKAMKAANDKAKKSMKGGKNLMASFARQFFNTDTLKTTKQFTNAAKLASAAIKRLSYDLYKNSDYFKQDKEALKKARKEVAKYSKNLKSAKKNRKSNTKEVKKSTKATKSHTKTVKKSTTATKKNNTQVKNASKNLKNARKELKKVKKEINKHINKSALQDTINGIANTIRSFVSISNVSFGSGQNIFEEYFSPNADELQENLNTVEDIKKEIENTQEEINKLNNINTRVAQKQVSELNERLEKLNEQLDKAQETVDKANAISADDLLNNVKSNEQGLIDYLSNRKMLDNSGLSTSLIRYIKDMGIEGNNMMVAALSLSNDQIKEINESYMNWKHQEGLMWMEDFKDRLKKVNSFSSVLGDLADKLPQKFLMEAANMGLDANDLLESLREFSSSEMKDLNTLYSDSLSIDTKAAKDIVASFARAGMDSAKGFGEGLAKGTSSAVKSANKFAKKIQNEVEKALGLGKKKKKKKASTKKKAKVTGGSYAVDVVNGFEEEVNELVTGDNGYSPLDALSNALNDLSNPENAPIITPVLDLTNVSNGALTIQDLLNNGYTLAGSSNFAINMNSEATNARLAAFQTSMETNFASLQNLLNGYLENGQNATVTNNFNINSSSPKEVADEVSRILQKQVERRQATWA